MGLSCHDGGCERPNKDPLTPEEAEFLYVICDKFARAGLAKDDPGYLKASRIMAKLAHLSRNSGPG